MQVSSSEQLRIQSSLYPWILFSLLNEQIEPAVDSLLPLKGLPKNGAFSITKACGTIVIWDRESRKVWMEPFRQDERSASKGKVGFQFRAKESAVSFYESGKLQLSSLRNGVSVFEWYRLLKSMLSTQSALGLKGWENASQDILLNKVMLTMGAAIAGLNGLSALDPFSKKLLEHVPNGCIRLHIDGVGDDLGRIQVEAGQLQWLNKEENGVGHEVDFRFRSLETAWKSVANLTDNLAAVGKGDIYLRGYIPLADGFNHMLDRLQMFVKSS